MVIQVRHDVNDTMLPDFRYHFDPDLNVKLEVSFDWKGMYCHFFREQKEVQTRLDERVCGFSIVVPLINGVFSNGLS